MPKKKINWELESETPVLNSPDCYYFRESGRVFISDSIAETPRVSPIQYTDAMVKRIIKKWIAANELNQSGWEQWHPLIGQVVGIFELTDEERSEHYRRFRETQLGKIEKITKTLNQLEKQIKETFGLISSEKVRLPELAQRIETYVHAEIQKSKAHYQKLKSWLAPTAKGEHKLLEGKLGPLIQAMEDNGLNQDQQARALCDLLRRFKYSDFRTLSKFPGLQPSKRTKKQESYINRAEGILLRSTRHYMKVLRATQN